MSMKALLLKAYGEPKNVLAVETVPKPVLDASSDRVLVRVRAASINPMDWMIANGTVKILISFPMPGGMGYDFSGVVESVGKQAGKFKPGDEIMGALPATEKGSMAEYVTVSAPLCALKPRSLSHEEASCLPIAGFTALQALKLHEGAKDVALIPAGMGGVGSLAIQLAKNHFGFKKVITTVSTPKVPLIKAAIPCVDEVIDYRTTKLESSIPDKSVDFILDDIQGSNPKSYLRFLNTSPSTKAGKPSLISVVGNWEMADIEGWWGPLPWYIRAGLGVMTWYGKQGIPKGVVYKGVVGAENAGDLEEMAAVADKGGLKPIIAKVFSLDEGVKAFEVAASGKLHGKIVIKVGDATAR